MVKGVMILTNVKKIIIIDVIYCICYFILRSKEIYTYGNIIEVYYPVCIAIGLILNYICTSNPSKFELLRNTGILIFITFLLPFILDKAFHSYFRRYYIQGYPNLLYFIQWLIR